MESIINNDTTIIFSTNIKCIKVEQAFQFLITHFDFLMD